MTLSVYRKQSCVLIFSRGVLLRKEIHLSPLQYDMLALFVRHAGRVVSHRSSSKASGVKTAA